MKELKRILKSIKPYEAVIYIIGYLSVLLSMLITRDGCLESIASLLFLTGVILNSKRSRVWFLISGVGMIIYSYAAFHNRFYSEIFINMFYMLPMQIYGFVNWGKAKEKNSVLEIVQLDAKRMALCILLCAAVSALYGYLLTFIGNAAPFAGAAGTVCSALAVMLAAKRVTQQFIFWMGNNVCIILMWVASLESNFSGLPIILVNTVFVVINFIGYLNWRKMYKSLKTEE